MLLRNTSIMELHYEPSTDIMSVLWPDIEVASVLIIGENIRLISESIRTYYIKRFLLDARQTTHIPEAAPLKAIYQELFGAISQAGLTKLARLSSKNPERDRVVLRVFDEVIAHPDAEKQICFQIRNFNEEPLAVDWLLRE